MQKKNFQRTTYNRAGCIVEPYNASRQHKFQFCQKVGKSLHVYVRVWLRPSHSTWAEIFQRMASLYKYRKTSKGRNFDSKA